MDYSSWPENMIATLITRGLEESSVRKAFEEGHAEIRAVYEKEDLNSAGAHFVKRLERHDLDLELAWERGQGRLKRDLAVAYKISEADVMLRFTRGAMKKTSILGWFRGEEVDLTASLNF